MPKFSGILMFPVMLLGPVVSGILLARALDGSSGLQDFFSRMTKIRIEARWYAALLIPTVTILIVLHSFRRFPVTHLESSCAPPALVKYWTGHAKSSDGEVVQPTVTDKYIKMEKDTKFRADAAERIGLDFEFPKTETEVIIQVFRALKKGRSL